MYVVDSQPDIIVGWLPTGSEISYWSTSDGSDPRTLPLAVRFTQRLGSSRRSWTGGGILRVIPLHRCWQVLHFWDPDTGQFLGWYINLESTKRVNGTSIDAVDWHLDLLLSPELVATWKDEDEAAAAVGTPYLRTEDLKQARMTGEAIASDPQGLINTIGDWRNYTPDPEWGPLHLPTA